MISLATHSLSAIHNLQASLDMISRTYSQEFNNALLYLFSKPNHQRKSIDEFSRIVAERAYEQLDAGLKWVVSHICEMGRREADADIWDDIAKMTSWKLSCRENLRMQDCLDSWLNSASSTSGLSASILLSVLCLTFADRASQIRPRRAVG